MEWLLFGLIGVFFLVSKKGPDLVAKVTGKLTTKEFLEKIAVAAQNVAHETGIPLSLIATQAAHESNYGNSKLTQDANNLFGIKVSADWVGPVYTIKTNEVVNGKTILVDADFRKYSTWEGSVRDWLKFIQKTRYAKAYQAALVGDSRTFFNELQKAGYATDPEYAQKLSGVLTSIESALA